MKEIDITKSRFRDATWFEKMTNYNIPIIVGGAGGIGSWLVLFLSRILTSKTPIILYDNDMVETVNLAGQLYRTTDVGKPKPEAVKNIVKDLSNFNSVIPEGLYTFDSLTSPIMFSAFDNMKSRREMFEKWRKDANGSKDAIFIDGRLLAEQIQIFFVTPDTADVYEKKYLFPDSDVKDVSCSYKQTSHFAAIIAAKMVQGLTNWFAGENTELPFFYEEIGELFLSRTLTEKDD